MRKLLLALPLLFSFSANAAWYVEYHGANGWGWGYAGTYYQAAAIARANCMARTYNCWETFSTWK